MSDTIHFHLPGYWHHQKLNLLLLALMRDDPDAFYPVKIGSVYDSFPSAIWNGGRIITGSFATREQIRETYERFAEFDVPLRHTFTNKLLMDTDVHDRYCNMILNEGKGRKVDVLVNSPILEEYVEDNFPDYSIISSTTKRLTDLDDLQEELKKDYNIVVLDYALNRDPHIFTLEGKEKLEILVNAYCCDNCSKRSGHYLHMSNVQLNFGYSKEQLESENGDDLFQCSHISQDFYSVLATRKSSLKVEDIYGFYHDMGFRHFKIEGRTNNPADVLESYIYYLVKPAFKDHIRLLLWRAMMTPDDMVMKNLVFNTPENIRKKAEQRLKDFHKDVKISLVDSNACPVLDSDGTRIC